VLKKTKIILVFALFALFGLTVTIKADYSNSSYSNENWDKRNGVDADDWIERGAGLVSESSDGKGILLTGGGEDSIPGMAAGVYNFEPPDWAKAFRIKIWYRDESGDDEIAGRVFIKTIDDSSQQTSDTLFYGDTFILRASQNSEIIRVSAERYIMNGTIEIHVVASGKDKLTVESLEMEYLREAPPVKIVNEYNDDYWGSYPGYSYWYYYWYWSPYYYYPYGFHYVRWHFPADYYWHHWRHRCRHHYSTWCEHHQRCGRRYTDFYNDPPSRDHSARLERRRRVQERLAQEYTVNVQNTTKTDVAVKEKRYRDDQSKYQKKTRGYPIEVTKKSQRDFTKRDSKESRDIRVIDKERTKTEKEFRELKDKRDIKLELRSPIKERKEIREPRIEKKDRQIRTETKYKDKTVKPAEKDYQRQKSEKSSIRSEPLKETRGGKTEHKRK